MSVMFFVYNAVCKSNKKFNKIDAKDVNGEIWIFQQLGLVE